MVCSAGTWCAHLSHGRTLGYVLQGIRCPNRTFPRRGRRMNLVELQQEQYAHDLRNHSDILSLHRTTRLKHYGLHYAKYVGRLARGPQESKSREQTWVDTFIICLSAANTLRQRLVEHDAGTFVEADSLRRFADATGRFCEACEKIDHMEEFIPIALSANNEICDWVLQQGRRSGYDLATAARERRRSLAEKLFYIRE